MKRNATKSIITDAFILQSGKELEEIRQAEKKGVLLTTFQKEFVKQNELNGLTLNRKLLEAFHSLSRLKSVEQWICSVLSLDPIQQFPDSILWASSSFSVQSSSSSLSTLPSLLNSTFFQCSSSIDDFQKWIGNGIVLCNLLNVIRPGQIKTIYLPEKEKSLSNFKSRENIHFFLNGCRDLGNFRKGYEFFDIDDLLEGKNIPRVMETLTYLAKNSKPINSLLPEWEEIKLNQLAFNMNPYQSTDTNEEYSKNEIDWKEKENLSVKYEIDAILSPRHSSSSFSIASPPLSSSHEEERNNTVNCLENNKTSQVFSPNQLRREQKLFGENDSMDKEEDERMNNFLNQRNLISLGDDGLLDLLSKKMTSSSMESEKQASPSQKKWAEAMHSNGHSSPRSRSSTFADIRQFQVEPKSNRNRPIQRAPSSAINNKPSKETNYAEMKLKMKGGRSKWNADEILPYLFLGGVDAAEDLIQIQKRGITHILCLSGGKPAFPNQLKYLVIDALDSSDHDILSNFSATNQFISNTLLEGGKILVHCQKGVSRSSSVVIAYLMFQNGKTFQDAADFVCEKRPIVCPNIGFIKQLQLYEKIKSNMEGDSKEHILYRKIKLISQMGSLRINRSENKLESGLYLGTIEEDSVAPIFSCLSCGTKLFHSQQTIEHSNKFDEIETDNCCKNIDVISMKWMGDIHLDSGDLKCNNCTTTIGKWNWNGFKCNCGFHSKPSFSLEKDKLKF